MKINQVKEAAKLIEKYNEFSSQIKSVQSGPMELNFGGYTVTIAKSVEEDLRKRIVTNLILELEKVKSQMEEIGVEL
jgi:hypothetical protein